MKRHLNLNYFKNTNKFNNKNNLKFVIPNLINISIFIFQQAIIILYIYILFKHKKLNTLILYRYNKYIYV